MKYSATEIDNSQRVRVVDSEFSYDWVDSFESSDPEYAGSSVVLVDWDEFLSCIEIANYGTQNITVTINGKTTKITASDDFYSVKRIPFETEKFKEVRIDGYEGHEFSVDVYR